LKEFDIERVEGVKCLSRLSTIASRRDTKKRSNLPDSSPIPFSLESSSHQCIHSLSIFFLLFFVKHTMDISNIPEVPRSEPVLPPPEPPSSPPSIASDTRRPRKPPTVTPRSFRRFFTPRSLLPSTDTSTTPSTSRQALRALTSPAVNRLGPAFSRTSKAGSTRSPHDGLPEDFIRTPSRKRKNSFSSVVSPQSSPLKRVRVRSPTHDVEQDSKIPHIDIRLNALAPPSPPKRNPPVAPVRRSQALQSSGALFMRTVAGARANKVTLRSNSGAGRYSTPLFTCTPLTFSLGWQDLTSNFYSQPRDRHTCASYGSEGSMALPFCNASCNSKSSFT
jgi:hypothetical protein